MRLTLESSQTCELFRSALGLQIGECVLMNFFQDDLL